MGTDRRPPPIARGNSEPTDEDFRQRYPRCTHPGCGASYPRGLVYCSRCHRPLEGAVVENIHKSREETQRGDNSEIAEIKREVCLRIRRLDDPNGPLRGARQLRRRPPSEEFRAYCADLAKRTIASKGCRLEDGRMVNYEDNIDCFRKRCEGPDSDSRYFDQIKEQIETKWLARSAAIFLYIRPCLLTSALTCWLGALR